MRINKLVLFPATPEALICAIARERGLILGLLPVALLCLAGDEPARGGERPSPQIVLVLVDDLVPGDVLCLGGTLVATPNLDRMAKDGIRFTRYYSPSRHGLIIGQFSARCRFTSYLQMRAGTRACSQVDYLDPRAPSLPRVLHDVGYRTAHFRDWPLGGGRDLDDLPKFAAYGYDEHAGTWRSPKPYSDTTGSNWIWSDKNNVKRWERSAFFVDKTLDFLARNKDRPCFVNVWLDDVHTPWIPKAATSKGASTPRNLRLVLEAVDRQIGRGATARTAHPNYWGRRGLNARGPCSGSTIGTIPRSTTRRSGTARGVAIAPPTLPSATAAGSCS